MKILLSIALTSILANSLLSETASITHTAKATNLSLQQVIDTCSAYYCIPKAVIVGVATAETGFGTGGVGTPQTANNLFGIKDAKYDYWKADTYSACTDCSKWRSYCTHAESVVDFCRFISLHYSFHFGKEAKDWSLKGYGNSRYIKGYFKKFEQ